MPPRNLRFNVNQVSPEVIASIKQKLGVSDELMQDILAAIAAGVQTPEEFLGFSVKHINYIEKTAHDYYRQQYYVEAMLFFLFVVKINAKRATAWRGLGACHQALKSPMTAIYAYQKAIALDPDDLISHVAMCECWFFSGFAALGLHMLKQVCQQTPVKQEYIACLKKAKAFIAAHG